MPHSKIGRKRLSADRSRERLGLRHGIAAFYRLHRSWSRSVFRTLPAPNSPATPPTTSLRTSPASPASASAPIGPTTAKRFFLSKTFGDAMEIDLSSKLIRNITAHYPHHGYTRALYLTNGDI